MGMELRDSIICSNIHGGCISVNGGVCAIQVQIYRKADDDAGVINHADVSGDDVIAADVHNADKAGAAEQLFRDNNSIFSDSAAVLHLADEGVL